MNQYLTADAIRAKVQAKLCHIAEATGDDELTTQHMLNQVCGRTVSLVNGQKLVAIGKEEFVHEFEDEILDWTANHRGLVQWYVEHDIPEAVFKGVLMANYNTFIGFQGRKCRVCEGIGCPRCDDVGFFDTPEPEQLSLF